MIKRLIAFPTNTPCCQMALATLTLEVFAEFYSSSFGILLIPDLWMCHMNLLDVCICCKSRIMDIWGEFIHRRSLTFTFHVSRCPCSALRPSMALVIVVHTSCLQRFPH